MHNKSIKRPKALRDNTPTFAKSALAVGLSAVLSSAAVTAQDETITLDTLSIEDRTIDTNPYAEPGAPYKAKVSGDKRRVKEIADTPTTISVLTQTQIKESGKTDLKEVLASQPGITLGTGENGNAFGDRYIIRGHESRSDVFVDSLRDPGMTTRESFATEQVEITKGPSSTFAGRGSTGGAINSVTKQASSEYDFNKIEAGLGTDDYRRVTLDSNQKLTDDLAVRVNLLHAYEEVPNRGPADRERNGIALSGALQATDQLSLVADYYYLSADDKPDLGTYIIPNGKPVKDIPVYLQDQDFLESDVETFTFRLNYEANDQLSIQNATRYGTTENGYVVTGARGATRDASDPTAPGDPTVVLAINNLPDNFRAFRTPQGWQDVEYFVNQTNIFFDTEIMGTENQFVFSIEYSDLQVENGIFNVTHNGATNCLIPGRSRSGDTPPPSDAYCILDANANVIVSDIGNLTGRTISRDQQDSDYNVKTTSIALMDTITLNDQWDIFAGIRMDRFDYSNSVFDYRGQTTEEFDYDDTLWNGHLGAVYKINDDGNVYLTYSTSANINGGESDVGGSCGYGGLCGDAQQVTQSEPETTENIELGTKWNLLDDKLLFTAAIFQITKDDVMENVGDDYASLGTLNTGKNRVKGAELSLIGNISDKLSTQFGVAVMDSEVLETIQTDRATGESLAGNSLSNFVDESLFLQLRYQLTDKMAFGGSATYSSEVYTGQPDSAASNTYKVPSYTVFDLFASYDFTDKLSARLNIGNVTDKDYYLTTYRSGAFTYIGNARNAKLTLNYEF